MNYRHVEDIKDFKQIIELQNKNLAKKLNDIEKKRAFYP